MVMAPVVKVVEEVKGVHQAEGVHLGKPPKRIIAE
jgi:hypothetical protein